MTTIAWDGKHLAADTLAVNGNGSKKRVKKLFRVGGGLYAGCGSLDNCLLVRNWIAAKMPEDRLPSIVDEQFTGIFVVKSGRKLVAYEISPRLVLVEFMEPHLAIGNGSDFALSAMKFGKSAKEAVEFASQFDAFTNNIVDCETL